MIQNTDSIPQILSRVDTLYIDRVDPKYQEIYIDLLEKSNSQLSLVGNPLAWLIGGLGVLFAAGAIVSGIHFWFLNKKFDIDKRTVLSEFDQLKVKYQTDLDDLVKAHKNQLNVTNDLISTLEKEGKVSKIELEKLRGSVHRSTNAINQVSRDIPITFQEFRTINTTCTKCNKEFSRELSLNPHINKGEKELFQINCPHCGAQKNLLIKH